MLRDGDKLIIALFPAKSLLGLLAEREPIEDSFPNIDDRVAESVDL